MPDLDQSPLDDGRVEDIFNSSQMSEAFKPRQKVLDIGTGSGNLAKLVEHRCQVQVTRLDIKDSRIQPTLEEEFISGDVHYLPFSDKTFDVVMLIDVLHHCKDPKQALLESKRVLKDQGQLLIIEDTLPNNPLLRTLFFPLAALSDDIWNKLYPWQNPHSYRSRAQWLKLFSDIKLKINKKAVSWYWGLAEFMPNQFPEPRTSQRTLIRPFECTTFVLTK